MISGTFPAKVRRRLGLLAWASLAVILLPGCDPDPYPSDLVYPQRTDLLVLKSEARDIPSTYRPGQLEESIQKIRQKMVEGVDKMRVQDPADLEPAPRKEIFRQLNASFGKPAAPFIGPEDYLDAKAAPLLQKLHLDGDALTRGSVLYRRHCLHCHGVTGDGRGPTAAWINPPPRDFRRGAFKFTSVVTSDRSKPTRDDLLRTLRQGIEGTAMPTFKMLRDDELNNIISYVIHLSIRGMVEFEVVSKTLEEYEAVKKGADKDPSLNVDSLKEELLRSIEPLMVGRTSEYLEWWDREAVPFSPSQDDPLKRVHPYPPEYEKPEEFAKSVERGYQLFIGKGICNSCHTDFGRQSLYMYDIWGTLVKPNNLTQGVYRGGRRPIDLYFRIMGGIPPSTMPAVTEDLRKDEKAMWDLVNFVRALPYPPMLPEAIRGKVYGKARK